MEAKLVSLVIESLGTGISKLGNWLQQTPEKTFRIQKSALLELDAVKRKALKLSGPKVEDPYHSYRVRKRFFILYLF